MKEAVKVLKQERKALAKQMKTIDAVLAKLGAGTGTRRKGSRARLLAGRKAAATKRKNRAKAEAEAKAAVTARTKPAPAKPSKAKAAVSDKAKRAAELRAKRVEKREPPEAES